MRDDIPAFAGVTAFDKEMIMQVLDPTFEEIAAGFVRPPRLRNLRGATIGVISNGKEGTAYFFAHLEHMLRSRYGVADVVQRIKVSLSTPAERAIMDEAAQWDAAITGVGD